MQGINNVFEYSLASGQECETFAIDPITARITLCDATVLDYETVTSYDFMVSLYIHLDYYACQTSQYILYHSCTFSIVMLYPMVEATYSLCPWAIITIVMTVMLCPQLYNSVEVYMKALSLYTSTSLYKRLTLSSYRLLL